MSSNPKRADYILRTVIVLYTGVIYSTLSIVSAVRRSIENRFGSDVYNNVYWVFGAIAAGIVVYLLSSLRGRRLYTSLAVLLVTAAVYWYNLSSMIYPAEKIHFLEYGLLGVLLLAALRRRCAHWVAVILAAAAAYWAGLGDEAIQWFLPDRVGEIRDSIINLLSAGLGIAAAHFTIYMYRPSNRLSSRQLRSLPAAGAATTVLTVLFLVFVHGFGYVVEDRNVGRIFSHFSGPGLGRINAGGFPGAEEQRIYENEALRHFHQREFYLTNDYRARDGSLYRVYDRAQFENDVLETYYYRYLDDNSGRTSDEILEPFDPDVAAKVKGRPVVWPDSLKEWIVSQVGRPSTMLESRVKSTIIRTFTLRDLLFYAALILLVMAYAWLWTGPAPSRRRGPPAGAPPPQA